MANGRRQWPGMGSARRRGLRNDIGTNESSPLRTNVFYLTRLADLGGPSRSSIWRLTNGRQRICFLFPMSRISYDVASFNEAIYASQCASRSDLIFRIHVDEAIVAAIVHNLWQRLSSGIVVGVVEEDEDLRPKYETDELNELVSAHTRQINMSCRHLIYASFKISRLNDIFTYICLWRLF